MTRINQEKVVGCLLGAAVGDALAFPFEGMSRVFTAALGRDAVQGFRAHRAGRHGAGQATAYTQLALAVAGALCESGGGSIGDDVGAYLFPLARDRALVEPPDGVVAALEGWARGRNDAAGVCRAAPVHLVALALLPYESTEAMLRDLAAAAHPSGQDHAECLAAGAVFASAVRYAARAEEVVLGDLLDVARNGALHFSREAAEAVNTVPDVICMAERDVACAPVTAAAAPALLQVLSGIVSFLKSPHDGERAFLIALRSGAGRPGAFVCGALAGAFNGARHLPAALVDRLSLRAGIVDVAAQFGACTARA